MRRLWTPLAALCAVALLAPVAHAQTPPPTPLPATPTPIESPLVEEPSPPALPEPEVDVPEIEKPTTDVPAPPSRPSDPAPTPSNDIWWDVGYRYPGIYSTAGLMSLQDRLERIGVGDERARRAYAPFIVAGYARFWDSWGVVRRASTGGLRPHLGQDVFCTYGAPVLATESGTVEFGSDATGGLVARVHRGDGSYWYYAHLSGIPSSMRSGQSVGAGDVIGYCGTSGNAAGTPPHVHFGLFVNHVAQNPMGALIGWLNRAEARAHRLLKKLTRKAGGGGHSVAKVSAVNLLTSTEEARCYSFEPEPLELILAARITTGEGEAN